MCVRDSVNLGGCIHRLISFHTIHLEVLRVVSHICAYVMSYSNLDAIEALEDAEAESSAALDLLAEQLRTLKGEPQGLTQLLSVCSQQVGVCRRLVRAFEVEVQGSDLQPAEKEHASSACKQQRERLATMVRATCAVVGDRF